MHLLRHLSNLELHPYKRMGAPACPGVPWGLAFETWDTPS